ncbi:hypothetical protein ACJX0J_021892, partial [Zea mays]
KLLETWFSLHIFNRQGGRGRRSWHAHLRLKLTAEERQFIMEGTEVLDVSRNGKKNEHDTHIYARQNLTSRDGIALVKNIIYTTESSWVILGQRDKASYSLLTAHKLPFVVLTGHAGKRSVSSATS